MTGNNSERLAFPMMPSHTDPASVAIEYRGLTKREYFAALAMQGMISNMTALSDCEYEFVSKLAVRHADTLLAKLEEENGKIN